MRLLTLALRNFRAHRDLVIDTAGEDVNIYGRNALGKTTIADAYSYLLTGKDSRGQATFDIKTIDPRTGQPIHNLEHEVIGTFDLGGGDIVELKKVYKEKWVQTRGKQGKEFSGHTTDYYIDGVPKSEKDYVSFIQCLCSEEQMRLLTDPSHFAETLHWKKRREILLEVCGDVTDAEVIERTPSLEDLPGILGKRSADDHRAKITADRKRVGERLKEIPARIDELSRSLGADLPRPEDPAPIREQVKALQEQKARISAGGESAEKWKRLAQLEGEAQQIINRLKAESSKGYDAAIASSREAEKALGDAQFNRSRIERTLTQAEEDVKRFTAEVEKKRAEFHAEKAKEFAYQGVDSCPACKQPLPQELVFEARANAESQFNRAKAERLEAIQTDGKQIAARLDKATAASLNLKEMLAALPDEQALQQAAKDAAARAESLRSPQIDPASDPMYEANKAAQEQLRGEIEALAAGNQDEARKIDEQIAELSARIQSADQANALILARKQSEGRIAELEAEEKELFAETEKIDRELFLIEEFIRAKVRMLTDKINGRFKLATFRLFQEQINGGLSEACDVTIGGRPYATALSNSERINVGLDIIQTLSEHYGFAPPITIDNAESVTDVYPTTGQQIRLIVSPADAVIRVETTPKENKKAS